MKLLLTGGTGFVGKALRRSLAGNGHDVRLLLRRPPSPPPSDSNLDDIVRGDVLDTNCCLRACDGREAVIHLVGIIRERPGDGITFDQLHTAATANMADAAGRQGVKRFIYMSALGARETAVSDYHRTKFASEKILKRSPLAWTIFRPSVIFGRGGEFIPAMVQMIRRRIVPLIGGGKSRLQPVSIDDVCGCVTASLRMAETRMRVFELGGPEKITFAEMTSMIGAILGVKPVTFPAPSFIMKPLVRIMDRFPNFPLTSDQLTMLLEDNVCDTQEVENVFGFRPASFIGALNWLLKEYCN